MTKLVTGFKPSQARPQFKAPLTSAAAMEYFSHLYDCERADLEAAITAAGLADQVWACDEVTEQAALAAQSRVPAPEIKWNTARPFTKRGTKAVLEEMAAEDRAIAVLWKKPADVLAHNHVTT